MLEVPEQSLLSDTRPGRLGLFAGRLLALGYKLTGLDRYDKYRVEKA